MPPPSNGMVGTFPTPGASQYPPQFSYGLQPTYGNMAMPASMAMSGVGNLPSAMSTVGMAAGVGSMFSASPVLRGLSFMDPTTLGAEVGMARFGAARAAGMGFGSAVGAGAMAATGPMLLAAAGMAFAQHTGQQFMTGGREQLQLGAQLSSIGFANPMASGGRGFGFQQQRQIGSMMREIDAADPFTTMRDLNGMMDQFTGMGMHRGVEDAREFGRKFKEFSGSVREMAKTMGTTMEEAGRVFGEMRQSGFYSSRDVMGNTRAMQTSVGMGMDQGTYMGMQAQGAQASRGAMLTGRAGALTASRFSQDLMMGGNDERLMDITGAGTGAEAAAALGSQFTSVMSRYLMGTAGGKAMLAGVGTTRGGQFTGEADASKLGNVKLSELSGVGRANLGGSARSKASFVTHQREIASSLLESENGVDAVLSVIEQEAAEHFRGQVATDDATKLFYEKQLGVDARFAEMLVDTTKKRAQNRLEWMRRTRQEGAAEALRLDMARNYTVGGIMQQVGGGISDLFAPVKDVGAGGLAMAQGVGQSAMDTVMGISRSPINDASVRASLGRFSRGTAQAAPGMSASVSDFSAGAGQLTALSAGAERALADQRTIAAGGAVTMGMAMAGLGPQAQSTMQGFYGTKAGQQVGSLLAQAHAAEQLEDATGSARYMDQAREAVLNAFPSERGILGAASADKLLAAVAVQGGQQGTARKLLGGGATTTHGYDDAVTTHAASLSAFRGLGITGDLAEQLGNGGAGSELFSNLTMDPTLGGGRDYVKKLADRAEVRDLEGEDYFSTLADIVSKERGIPVTSADMRNVMTGYGQIEAGADKGSALNQWLSSGVPEIDYKKLLTAAGTAGRVSTDSTVRRGTITSAADALAGLNPEVKKALGKAGEGAVASLREQSFGGMAQLLRTAGSSALEGVGGVQAEELHRLGQQYNKALDYANTGDIEEIEKIYGKLSDKQRLDLSGAVTAIAGEDAVARLGSGANMGIERRGQTVQQQVSESMLKVSENADKTAKLLDNVVTNMDKPWFLRHPAGE